MQWKFYHMQGTTADISYTCDISTRPVRPEQQHRTKLLSTCAPSEYTQQDLRFPQGCVRGFRTSGKWHGGARWVARSVLKNCNTFLFKGCVTPAVLELYDAWHSATSPEDLNPTVHILNAVKQWGSSSYTVVCVTAVFWWYKATRRWQVICTVKYVMTLCYWLRKKRCCRAWLME